MTLTGSVVETPPAGGPSQALHTDHYELTMLEAALASGVAPKRAVFEVFARRLPPGRRYGVLAGVERLAEAVCSLRFGPEELDAVAAAGVVGPAGLERLAGYRFSGSIDAYAEGELFFPFSPVLTVEATFAEAVVLETLVLSVLNHDSAVASAAARMTEAAQGRTLIEMGSRRTHEEAAVDAARAAYLAGFTATSNLEAGRRYRVPTTGTASHAFVLAHADERAAFRAQIDAQGPGTTLLVDTFDIAEGIRAAVEVAGPGLGAIRIDSGNLAVEARRARALLDSLGAGSTRIVVSGDLDEYAIEELAPVPIDAYGVGSKVVSGSGAPSASFVYKLVAIAGGDGDDQGLRPVGKRSAGKTNRGGRKTAWRVLSADGLATGEVVAVSEDGGGTGPPDAGLMPADWMGPSASARPLQTRVVEDGRPTRRASLAGAREHRARAMVELAPLARMIVAGPPALEVTFVGSPVATEAVR
ncbi:MAG: nicotinate phosphoribosyltransferase [Acidimicrobiales bacterium]